MRRRMLGYDGPADLKRFSKERKMSDITLRVTLSRLSKQSLIEKSKHEWIITDKGKKLFRRILRKKEYEELSRRNKNMIISFDIPEKLRKQRAWLRYELTLLGFSPIHQSVWLGPAPLPKSFIQDLNGARILNYLKFFKATIYDIV